MAKKQRNYSSEFKAKVVLELVSGKRSPTEASRAHQVHMSVLCRWKNEFIKQAHRAFENKESNDESAQRIADLERMIGRLTMELEIAKKASDMWNLSGSEKW